jgi:hypothetical protein
MKITTMTQMWSLLDTYTLRVTNGKERPVNQQNEWGGFSKRLNMPVFTGWMDFSVYDKETKETKVIVCDTEWENRVSGIKNQEYWLTFAEKITIQ